MRPHPVLVTHCNGCQRRIHAPDPQSFTKQKMQHLRNCGALKLHGQLPRIEALPPRVVKGLEQLGPRRTFWQRVKVLFRALRRAVFG